ncbi:MAG: alkaline phosphatase family protein [Candidatus Thorarchaeota archaeon]
MHITPKTLSKEVPIWRDTSWLSMRIKPNYTGGGITNLMSSIASAVGAESPYPELSETWLSGIEESKNIVLMAVDGLGYDYLMKHGKNTVLASSMKGLLTSVFPPSTGSAITTFIIGLPPQQHAVTGWYVFLKEYGIMSRILPFTSAVDWNVLDTDIANVVNVESLFWKIERERIVVAGKQIVDSAFSLYTIGFSAKRIAYEGLQNFFTGLEEAISSYEKPSYIYAYWPELDSIAHILGIESKEAREHLQEFDDALRDFIERIEGTDTTLIITSDHGLHDVNPDGLILTGDHPELVDSLTLPLCGDTRSAYCYVRPSRIGRFEDYINSEFEHACTLHRSEDLVSDDWFGLYEANPRLSSRVGDYTLIFNDEYAVLNSFPGQEPPSLIGHHGGISSEEMNVPLILINC